MGTPEPVIDPTLYRTDHAERVIYGKTPESVDRLCRTRGKGTKLEGKGEMGGCYIGGDDVGIVPEGSADPRSPQHWIYQHEVGPKGHRFRGEFHK